MLSIAVENDVSQFKYRNMSILQSESLYCDAEGVFKVKQKMEKKEIRF